MKEKDTGRAAMAVLAAVAGAGFSSGREVALFFSQMGRASWLGVGVSAATFGGLCGMLSHLAHETGAETFPGLCARVLEARQGRIVGVLYSLMMAMTAGVMLAAAGELGALALPFHNAFWMGMLLALAAALLLNLKGMRAMPAAGWIAAALCGLFFCALALDGREPPIYRRYETVPELSGSATAAILFAALHAAMNASIAAGLAVCFGGRTAKPLRFALECGGGMLLLLAAANAAILRGGERLLSQALPAVVLAARWGKAGYHISLLVMGICVTTTLAAALGGLIGSTAGRGRPRMAILVALAAASATVAGVQRLIEIGYPIVGWACAFSLAALAGGFEWKDLRRRRRRLES